MKINFHLGPTLDKKEFVKTIHKRKNLGFPPIPLRSSALLAPTNLLIRKPGFGESGDAAARLIEDLNDRLGYRQKEVTR